MCAPAIALSHTIFLQAWSSPIKACTAEALLHHAWLFWHLHDRHVMLAREGFQTGSDDAALLCMQTAAATAQHTAAPPPRTAPQAAHTTRAPGTRRGPHAPLCRGEAEAALAATCVHACLAQQPCAKAAATHTPPSHQLRLSAQQGIQCSSPSSNRVAAWVIMHRVSTAPAASCVLLQSSRTASHRGNTV